MVFVFQTICFAGGTSSLLDSLLADDVLLDDSDERLDRLDESLDHELPDDADDQLNVLLSLELLLVSSSGIAARPSASLAAN